MALLSPPGYATEKNVACVIESDPDLLSGQIKSTTNQCIQVISVNKVQCMI